MSENNSRGGKPDDTGRWGSLPGDLKKYDQWIVTKDKRPIHPTKGWNKKSNQLAFDEAREEATKADAELGFALNEEDPFAMIDLDDVGRPANHTGEVTEIVENLATYTEVSRSGSGLHIVCQGEHLPGHKNEAPLNQRGSIEVYDSNRQIVLTGDLLEQRSTIVDRNKSFRELQQRYLPKKQTSQKNGDADSLTSEARSDRSGRGISIELEPEADGSENGPTVDQIKRTIDAHAAKDEGDEARRAKKLWESSGELTYPSTSHADEALASDLAFWCRADAQLMYRCLRRSDRYDSGWEKTSTADGATYAELTFEKAIRTTYDTFSGRYVQ